jgi:hypothetical protein
MATFVAVLKSIAKGVASLILAAITLLLFVVFFGTWEERYKCQGHLETTDGTTPATIFLKVKRYRAWMFWTDENGVIWSEGPGYDADYYPNVRVIGDYIHFSSYNRDRIGDLSTLSYLLGLGGKGKNFQGECAEIERK